MSSFEETFRKAYAVEGPAVEVGHVLRDGQPVADLPVRIPLAMMNRHGLIAGSTGTGKTRTLQVVAEELSRHGVPVFLADVKGDLAGMSVAGTTNDRIQARAASVGRQFTPESFPVEFFSLTGRRGIQLRATVSSFGPILLGKVLDLSETQQSVLAMVFQYCDDRQLPLLDFHDLRETLNYLANEGKSDLRAYGAMSPQTVGVLLRKMIELEQQGATQFFGEPELDIADLMRTRGDQGIVNILSLADVQDKPRLYSTFLMWLLGRFYYGLPEVGDLDKPKLVFFFDEAHQLFDDASSALVEYIEQVARLIRSKGIGVFFITQTAKDIDEDVLAQLGNRVQHAVRAFTPKDARDVRAAATTFPTSEFYDIENLLTSLGIGEALVSFLDRRGAPTAAAAAQILPPSSSMAAIDDEGYDRVMRASAIALRYGTAIDRESAREILQRKLAQSTAEEPGRAPARAGAPSPATPRKVKKDKSVMQEVFESRTVQTAARQAARTAVQQVVRGLFGLLKGK